MKLDYSLTSLEDRKALVNQIIDSSDYLSTQQLGYMADYLLYAADSKQTQREKSEDYPIVTRNRNVTVKKRQVSFEETAANLQNGEDGIYAMMINDKNVIMDNKSPITQYDIDNIPGIRENLEVIDSLKTQFDAAEGRKKYSLKSQIISKYQELYTLKGSYSGVSAKARLNSQLKIMAHMPIPEKVWVGEDGMPRTNSPISLLRADHISFLLKYYRLLKQECWGDFQSDMYYLLLDLENLVEKALLPDNEVLYDLLVWEIDGLTGLEISDKMARKYGIIHSEQYFSTLWCKRIPKILAEQAQKDWLVWHYTFEAPEDGHWKICKTCGKRKLAHSLFFHKNTSRDGFYSKCRDCRSKKGGR